MKISIETNELLRALTAASKVAQKKVVLEILSNVLIRKTADSEYQILANDSDNELTLSISLNEVSGQWQDFCVNPFHLLNAVQNLEPQTIVCDIVENHMTVSYNNSGSFTVPVLEADTWPTMTVLQGEEMQSIALPTSPLLSMVKAAASCRATNDNLRPAMGCVLLDADNVQGHLTIVGSDGHRLYKHCLSDLGAGFVNGGTAGATHFLLTPQALSVLGVVFSQEENVTVTTSKTHIEFQCEGATLVSKLPEQRFPAYQKVIPSDQQNSNVCTLSRQSLVSAVKRVSAFGSSSELLQLSFHEGKVMVSAEDIDFGKQAKEQVSLADSNFTHKLDIGAKASTLLHLLSLVEDDTVRFLMNDGRGAILLRPDKDNAQQTLLLMPMLLDVA